jgi:hypothetical protein
MFEAGFVKKHNDDGWHTLLAAGVDRNIVVYDALTQGGYLSLRLISLMKQAMRRNAGGNTTSLFRGMLTDLYMSIEMLESMRNWTVAEVDAVTRREIFTSDEGYVSQIFKVNLHEMVEFGVGQEYQNYYLDPNGLNGQLATGDVEVLVGLDRQRNDSFINPIKREMEVYEDELLHRQRRGGVYGWTEHGFAVLDARRIILGSA